MSRRIKPYTTNQETWNHILQKTLRIPMNQRLYEWKKQEITKFLDDIFNIFEECKYVEKMGSIINLKYNNVNDIYDGQQRILTTILILYVIGCFSEEKLKNKIEELLTVDTDIDTLTSEQQKMKDEYNVNKIPKIYCINPYDRKGLVDIFNDKIESPICYLKNLDEIDSFDKLDEYVSRSGVTLGRKKDFIRHIEKQDKYNQPPKNNPTNLYEAFIDIYNYIALKKYDKPRLIKLYKFILEDIDIQYYDCTDPQYVSRIFDWENNRGKAVKTLDIIKNPILVKIPDYKKTEVYDKWELLKHKQSKIKDFGTKIFDVAIQIYNNKINRTINQEELFKPIIENENTYEEINKFFTIVEKLFNIMDKISNDRFGRLLNHSPRICINWEAYEWCLLPIFYKKDNIDKELIKLFTKWYFRNLQFKNRNFNNLSYSNEFIRVSNKVLEDENYDYYKDIRNCLINNKDKSISDENYLREMENKTFKSTNATHLLAFLETCINTDTHRVPLDYTLEHIFCQKNKHSLADLSLMDNIGNLTLIEGKNSDNGHKGNSSLGSKSYEKKKKSYKDSSCMITRKVVEKYETFTEEKIKERNMEIVSLLNEYTNY